MQFQHYFDIVKSHAVKILAGCAIFFFTWIAVGAILPQSKDNKFISAVKTIQDVDEKNSLLIQKIRNNAQRTADAYKIIQETGGGSRFYSKYEYEIGTGSITIKIRDYNAINNSGNDE